MWVPYILRKQNRSLLVVPVQRCLHLFRGLCRRRLRRLPVVALSGLSGGGFAADSLFLQQSKRREEDTWEELVDRLLAVGVQVGEDFWRPGDVCSLVR